MLPTKCYDNLFNSCQDISLWTKVVKHLQVEYYTVNADLYLIHRGITVINFPIIQPVVVVEICPHISAPNSCLIM